LQRFSEDHRARATAIPSNEIAYRKCEKIMWKPEGDVPPASHGQ